MLLGRRVYLRECSSCHGDAADGAGREAAALRPRPRDFTAGVFKFRTTPSGQPPASADILRTIGHGLPGTGMCSFASLTEAERHAVAAFVLRTAGLLDGDEPETVPPPVSHPPGTPERLAIGKTLYADAGCPKCHGAAGRPDAESTKDLKNADGTPTAAPDLTTEQLPGGDTPIDLYYRLMTGVDGSPMASFAQALEGQDVWALVDYVLSVRGRAGLSPPDVLEAGPACARAAGAAAVIPSRAATIRRRSAGVMGRRKDIRGNGDVTPAVGRVLACRRFRGKWHRVGSGI
jgi:cytochrome c oxidase cbb3-type subunit 2